jgi:hypothetical protein
LAWWRVAREPGLRPTRAARVLRQAYRVHTLESAGHEQHLQEALPLLRAAGVEPILIKGWSVARLYPETGLRPYGDLDLCVAPNQAPAAMAALTRLDRPDWEVELHQGVPDLRDRTWRQALARSRLVRLVDVDVRILGHEDALRLHCMHLLRHGGCAPLWLCDIAVLLESLPPGFDWDYCLDGRAAWAAWVLCLVRLTRELLGARFPGPPDGPPSAWVPGWVLDCWGRPAVGASRFLDPVRSAYRRGLSPHHSRGMTQVLGLLGRAAEAPRRLLAQVRRWRRPAGRPFVLHDEPGA